MLPFENRERATGRAPPPPQDLAAVGAARPVSPPLPSTDPPPSLSPPSSHPWKPNPTALPAPLPPCNPSGSVELVDWDTDDEDDEFIPDSADLVPQGRPSECKLQDLEQLLGQGLAALANDARPSAKPEEKVPVELPRESHTDVRPPPSGLPVQESSRLVQIYGAIPPPPSSVVLLK
jgi:hypothetical protein